MKALLRVLIHCYDINTDADYFLVVWFFIFTLFTSLFKFAKSSSSQVFYKKGVLKNFLKFTGKQLYGSHFLITLQDFSVQLYLKKETLVVFCEFCKVFKNMFYIENLRTTASALPLCLYWRMLFGNFCMFVFFRIVGGRKGVDVLCTYISLPFTVVLWFSNTFYFQ